LFLQKPVAISAGASSRTFCQLCRKIKPVESSLEPAEGAMPVDRVEQAYPAGHTNLT
jgi:hypothetical protein